jgi:hypothetical protein
LKHLPVLLPADTLIGATANMAAAAAAKATPEIFFAVIIETILRFKKIGYCNGYLIYPLRGLREYRF